MAYWKKIANSNAVPVLKEDLVFDTTPTVNSFNPVTSDGVARAVAGASGEVPVVTENDNGKVLSAIYDEHGPAVEWADAPSGVPEYSAADNGKVLGVVTTGVEETPELDWVDQPESTVSTDGVISGDGSVADPVVLNVGAGLSSASGSSEWGDSSSIYKLGDKGFTVPAAVAVDILTNNKNVQLTLPNDDGVWSIQDTQGGNYALALCYGSGNSWTPGVVFSPNYTDRWNNGYAYFSGFHGTKTVELDMSNLISNIDSTATDADRRAALLDSARENNDVLLTFSRYFNDGQGYYRYYTNTTNLDNYISYTNMSYKLGTPGATQLSVTNPVPTPASADNGKVLTVTNSSGSFGWADAPTELPAQLGTAGQVLSVNSGATGVEWATVQSGSSYTAGDGIAISAQNAISAVGGTGITVTSASTVTKNLTAHSYDYEAPWQAGLIYHEVTYISLLDSGIITDIQNGGIDVTLAYPMEQFTQGNTDYYYDWDDYGSSSFKAYAAIAELQAITVSGVQVYHGNTTQRLVLGEIPAPWAGVNSEGPTIAANTVVNYDFDDVNTSLSTISLASVLANPSNYCLTVMFYDTRISSFDDGVETVTCGVQYGYVTAEGTYTTGSYQATTPSAITVTNPVPAFDTTTDLGKVLTVTANGLEWVTPT